MMKINVIFLFFHLNYVLNEQIFYEISSNNYYKVFTKLSKEHQYIFVSPAVHDKSIFYGIKANKVKKDIFKKITAYNYFTYEKVQKGYSMSKIYYKLREINDDTIINFETRATGNDIKYIGIELIINTDINSLTLSVETNNTINLKYNESNTRNLLPFIPYFYFIEVDQYNKFIVDLSTKYITNLPFESFNITEFSSENDLILSDIKINSSFVINNDRYKFSTFYEIYYSNHSINYLRFMFFPDYKIEDFQIKMNVYKDNLIPLNESSVRISSKEESPKFPFSLIIIGIFIFIVGLIFISIIVKKRKKKSIDNKTNISQELPLLYNSNGSI